MIFSGNVQKHDLKTNQKYVDYRFELEMVIFCLFIYFIYLFIYLFIHLFELKPHGKAETFIRKSPRNYPGKFKEQVTFFQK